MTRRYSEEDEQIMVFEWAAFQLKKYPMLEYIFHVPNERKCSIQQGARLKKAGVKRGVPDICLPYPNKGFNGLWIEMKAVDGRVSDQQKAYIKFLNDVGYMAVVCYGSEDAIRTIKEYLE